MKKYKVTFYYHTSITVEVWADNEQDAEYSADLQVCQGEHDKQVFENIVSVGSDIEEIKQ